MLGNLLLGMKCYVGWVGGTTVEICCVHFDMVVVLIWLVLLRFVFILTAYVVLRDLWVG